MSSGSLEQWNKSVNRRLVHFSEDLFLDVRCETEMASRPSCGQKIYPEKTKITTNRGNENSFVGVSSVWFSRPLVTFCSFSFHSFSFGGFIFYFSNMVWITNPRLEKWSLEHFDETVDASKVSRWRRHTVVPGEPVPDASLTWGSPVQSPSNRA